MKSLNVTFEDQDYKKLLLAKENMDGTWHDVLLDLAEPAATGGIWLFNTQKEVKHESEQTNR
jgi:hypothetical protein